MPCNSIAVISIKLAVGTLNELRGNADALQALHTALEQITGEKIRVQLSGSAPSIDCYFITEGRNYRYVLLGANGLQLYGSFSAQERAAIEAFVNALPAAMAEQALVTALATQLTLLDDQPTYNELGQQVGRTLVVRV
ncbi:MAG TPA: hypothetical protein VGJ60_07285 [Chloroflexota bacterium]|jgi:hypothetical protein